MYLPTRHIFWAFAFGSTACVQILGLDDHASLRDTASSGVGGAMSVENTSPERASTTGAGAPAKKEDGATCASANDCTSGHCVSGSGGARVCCDSECGSACKSCLAVDTNAADGKCADTLAGLNPGHVCKSGACETGVCDGKGACGIAPQGTACGAPACDGGAALALSTCDDAGDCAAQSQPCSDNFACSGAHCLTSCVSESDCAPGFYCAAPHCQSQKGKGAPCTHAYECESSQCAMGRCT